MHSVLFKQVRWRQIGSATKPPRNDFTVSLFLCDFKVSVVCVYSRRIRIPRMKHDRDATCKVRKAGLRRWVVWNGFMIGAHLCNCSRREHALDDRGVDAGFLQY